MLKILAACVGIVLLAFAARALLYFIISGACKRSDGEEE